MSPIGPTLPPHLLSKRKREEDESESEGSDTSNRSSTSNGKKIRLAGPSMPPNHTRGEQLDHHNLNPGTLEDDVGPTSLDSVVKGNRTQKLGPAMPPADVLERPPDPLDDDDDSDDDFGPALPGTTSGMSQSYEENSIARSKSKESQTKPSRDDWMLAPPTTGNRSSSIDPSKMKNRGFSSGPRAAPKSGGDMSLWTETPEEKRKRLEEEMLGIKRNDQPRKNYAEQARAEAKTAELTRRVEAYNDKKRMAPLYSAKDREVDEDDPSKRAFDREKDIGGGKLSHSETKQMLNKAADFGSRFSKGSYL